MTPLLKLTIFNLISMIVVAGILFLLKRFVKEQKSKDLVLKIISIVVILTHYSALHVEFFQNNGQAIATGSYLLPIFPCHINMWLLVILAFTNNKESLFFKGLADFVFLVGSVAALIGALVNINFLQAKNPTFADYFLFKGVIGHHFLVLGCVYLFVGGYVNLRMEKTMASITLGFLGYVIIGFIINRLYARFGLPPVNAMYLLGAPFPAYPFINFLSIGIVSLIVAFIILLIYERVALPYEERWTTKISTKIQKRKEAKANKEE